MIVSVVSRTDSNDCYTMRKASRVICEELPGANCVFTVEYKNPKGDKEINTFPYAGFDFFCHPNLG